MSDQSQTTAKAPSDPVLCTQGCGFFGNATTEGCCSKCWRDQQKEIEAAKAPVKKPEPVVDEPMPEDDVKPLVEEKITEEVNLVEESDEQAVPAVSLKKKKKKKQNYKSLMASMVVSSPTKDVEKDKEALRKVTGGGAFTKVEKI